MEQPVQVLGSHQLQGTHADEGHLHIARDREENAIIYGRAAGAERVPILNGPTERYPPSAILAQLASCGGLGCSNTSANHAQT